LEKYRAQIETFYDFDEALLAVIFPIKKTGFQLEQEDMLQLVNIAEKETDLAIVRSSRKGEGLFAKVRLADDVHPHSDPSDDI